MRRRVDLFLIGLSLGVAIINLAAAHWFYVSVALLNVFTWWEDLRIDRLEAEITMLRLANLLDRQNSGDPGGAA